MLRKTVVPISVVIPTYKRVNDLRKTLIVLNSCNPVASEIIVHIDCGDTETCIMLQAEYPEVKVIVSDTTQGPGGGRNKGIILSENEYIASFDDDSYPVQLDYFERLYEIFTQIPNAAIVESMIYHPNEMRPLEDYAFYRSYLFTGCGVAYRKSWFLKIGGYIPLAVAYGIEEVDFSMRACQYDALFIRTPWLTVFHDTDLQHRFTSKVLTNSVTNIGVLTFLRYPISYWHYGVLQVLNRTVWTIKNNRKYKECIIGLAKIPFKSIKLIQYRQVLSRSVIKLFLKNRSNLIPYFV